MFILELTIDHIPTEHRLLVNASFGFYAYIMFDAWYSEDFSQSSTMFKIIFPI